MTPATTEAPPNYPELVGTRRFTPNEYHRLFEAGILGPNDRVELLDGYVQNRAQGTDLPRAEGPFPEWRALRRFTSAEYHRMLDLGIIDREEKLELLDGYLVLKMPQKPGHRTAVTCLSLQLPGRLPSGWLVMTQCPISLGLWNPEPDGAIVRGGIADYKGRDPIATDFGIVIEVSDSSLELDRTAKGRTYARAGIPVYWIVNVEDGQIEVYTEPNPTANPPEYGSRTDYRPGDTLPIVLAGTVVGTIAVNDLLP
jgi:Uma2 family endonuclease